MPDSPPFTPPAARARSASASPSDDSIIDDLSFDYVLDDNGNICRLDKGKGDTESPPTRPEPFRDPDAPALKPPDPDTPATGRASLSRSESAYPVLTGPSTATSDRDRARSFQRVTSGPAVLGPGRAHIFPRRVTLDEARDEKENVGDSAPEDPPPSAASRAARAAFPAPARPLVDVPQRRQINPIPARPGRVLKSTPKYSASAPFDRIPETDPSDSDADPNLQPGQAPTTRQRSYPPPTSTLRPIAAGPMRAGRVAKYSTPLPTSFDQIPETQSDEGGVPIAPDYPPGDDTEPDDDPPPMSAPAAPRQRTYALPASALAQSGSTRPRRSASLSDALSPEDRRSPGPPANSASYARPGTSLGLNANVDPVPARRVTVEERGRQEQEMNRQYREYIRDEAERRPSPRPAYGHKRRDSDTLRVPPSGSPTAVEPPPVPSSVPSRHRRSPTAPEAPTSNGAQPSGKVWSGAEEDRARTPAPVPSRQIVVNKKVYARLDMIGKGGSSRVYRVMNYANELYAIKRVSLDKTDADTMSGYMNEIALLKRLDGNSRIIRLVDSEVKAGPGGSKGHLLLVMECGEIDLARLLAEQQKEPMNMVWVAYYWQQMLQAVHVIHEEKIVHSDLKPANFVLVRGQLKLIDFGIANAIANDTTNIQRDNQIGTVNYMSPETIELPDGMRRLKVGRPSDVWSLGCILYQMVYGHPPFQHLSVYHKMKAIPDAAHAIEFPEYAVPVLPARGSTAPPQRLDHLRRQVRRDVIASMERCLHRQPKARATIPELLDQDWLAMRECTSPPPPPEPPAPPPPARPTLEADETVINPYYMRQLLTYGIKLGQQGAELDADALLREATRLVRELKELEQ